MLIVSVSSGTEGVHMVCRKKWFAFWDGHAEDPLGFMVLLWRIFPVKGYGDKLLFFFFFAFVTLA